MIYNIELNNTYANQEFDVEVNDNNIHVLLQTDEIGTLLMTVSLNNEQIGQPYICFPLQYVMPYKWQEDKLGGNFYFETVNDQYPSYEDFGYTCFLFFATKEDL